MKNKVFWLILALGVGGLIAVFALAGGNSSQTSNEISENINQEVSADDHVIGNKNATTTLVEYGDIQCPACATYAPIVSQLADEFAKKIRIVFRHFPLSSIHPNAYSAARAAEAAAAQGKFFEMVELLYARQDEWEASTNAVSLFREYAQELKLNLDSFNDVYNSQQTADRINHDISIANQLGVNSTPTFYLNGQKLENPRTYDDFKAKIKEALSKE